MTLLLFFEVKAVIEGGFICQEGNVNWGSGRKKAYSSFCLKKNKLYICENRYVNHYCVSIWLRMLINMLSRVCGSGENENSDVDVCVKVSCMAFSL